MTNDDLFGRGLVMLVVGFTALLFITWNKSKQTTRLITFGPASVLFIIIGIIETTSSTLKVIYPGLPDLPKEVSFWLVYGTLLATPLIYLSLEIKEIITKRQTDSIAKEINSAAPILAIYPAAGSGKTRLHDEYNASVVVTNDTVTQLVITHNASSVLITAALQESDGEKVLFLDTAMSFGTPTISVEWIDRNSSEILEKLHRNESHKLITRIKTASLMHP